MKKQGICILGSTGTIGINTLDVIRRHPQRFKVIALTANQQVERMLQQCEEWRPQFVVISDPDAAQAVKQALAGNSLSTRVLCGMEELSEVVRYDEHGEQRGHAMIEDRQTVGKVLFAIDTQVV